MTCKDAAHIFVVERELVNMCETMKVTQMQACVRSLLTGSQPYIDHLFRYQPYLPLGLVTCGCR